MDDDEPWRDERPAGPPGVAACRLVCVEVGFDAWWGKVWAEKVWFGRDRSADKRHMASVVFAFMAEGVRIVPRRELGWPADASVCVVDHSRPRKAPPGVRIEDIIPVCPWCGDRHYAKHYLIHLTAGSAIVSPAVWETLRSLADNPFEYANPVAEPPGQIIRPLPPGQHEAPRRPELREKFVMPLRSPNNRKVRT